MFHALVLLCLCRWHLIGVFSAQTLSVTEGDSVTLHNDLSQIHEEDEVMWNFVSDNSLIAQINRASGIFLINNNDIFRDRLKLDQTGSLTITNITTQHTGVYKLEIISAKLSSKAFRVSVFARLPTPYITRDYSQNLLPSSSSSSSQKNCSLLCSVVNVSDVTLSWFRGNSLLSSISVSDLSISLSLPLEVEYQDNNTYSCVLNNTITNHTTHLDISEICQIHSELSSEKQGLPLLYILLFAAAAGCLLIVAAVMTCCICKNRKKRAQTPNKEDSGSALCKPKTQKKKSRSDAVYENIPKKR